MRFSTRSDYGIILMAHLARKWGKGPVSLRTIAEEERLSFLYLEQLVAALRKQGLVRGSRGAAGGYELARAPERMNVREVVWALEGHGLVPCAGPGGSCARVAACAGRKVWLRLQRVLNEAMEQLTLAEIADVSHTEPQLRHAGATA